MSTKILYETEHKKAGHFSFGKNWQSFLQSLTSQRVKIAQESLQDFLGGKNCLKDKTFIDIGCGSGIFSLAAHRLRAAKVVSVDVDESSLSCARFLKKEEGNPINWEVSKASALQAAQLKKLGQFDVVYSWGVLHHTGDMYTAIKNAATLVKPDGKFFISIYNHSVSLKHGKSSFWQKAKKHYNVSGPFIKRLYVWVYSSYLFLGLFLSGQNPLRYITNYQSARGMSWHHDVLDWLGGHPYEYATPEEIISYVGNLGFTIQKIQAVTSIGCNEFVFMKNKPIKSLPSVTVLMSVHNNAETLNKTLQSIFNQTLSPQLLCINDASTDNTELVLQKWKNKVGDSLKILTNDHNIGLTRSLNKGLKQITTPYTARIDADDWWEPTKLEKQINFLEINRDYGVVGCWYTNYSHKRHFGVRPAMTNEVIRKIIIRQNPFAHSCVVFRTQMIQKLGGYDETVRYGQDYELWMRCLPQTKFFNIPENLCHRSFTGGISIEKQHEQMRYAIRTRLKYIRLYRLPIASYTSLIEPWLVRITPRWLADLKRTLGDR